MILGVSQTELTLDLSVTGIAVEIQKIEGAKCTRCWIYKTDIGQDAHAPDLCQRCAAAVAVWSKAHPELAAGAQA
jgi:isoleucyl-tRNA synthetase